MMLVHELNKVLDKISVKYNLLASQVPVLICGDFNSLPDSGYYYYHIIFIIPFY
jgi:endonuclease/exonuclease/phosphatase family metal-dependent hydrolase